jgi:hypothetical protein
LASRDSAVLAAKRLRPAAVEYLQRLENHSSDLAANEVSSQTVRPIAAPGRSDAPLVRSNIKDASGPEPRFFEQDVNAEIEWTPLIQSPQSLDSLWTE